LTDNRRRNRREIRQLSSESTWLQKALFALQKADEAREKVAEYRGEDAPAFVLSVGRKKIEVEEFEEAIEGRIRELLDEVRERRRGMR
jgi:hypothetical protein